MKKIELKLSVNILTLLTFLVALISGIVTWTVLPQGEGSVFDTFLGLNRFEWRDIHIYVSLIFSAIAIIHILLGFNWFKSALKGV